VVVQERLSRSAAAQIIALWWGVLRGQNGPCRGVGGCIALPKKGIAFPWVRAHSDFTAINLDHLLVSVLAAQHGEIFNL
jgi:hypothetical protein